RQARGIVIQHNLIYDVNASRWGGDGRFVLIGEEPADITIDHNTVIHSGSVLQLYGRRDGRPRVIRNLRLTNNLTFHNEYGILGDDEGIGRGSIDAYLAAGEVRRNVIAGGDGSRYPDDNFFPSVAELMAQFVDPEAGNYQLRPDSRF